MSVVDVHLLSVGEERPVLDNGCVFRHQLVSASRRARRRGVPWVGIAVAVFVVPSVAVHLVFVAAVVPVHSGGGVRWAGNGGRGEVPYFGPGGGGVRWVGSSVVVDDCGGGSGGSGVFIVVGVVFVVFVVRVHRKIARGTSLCRVQSSFVTPRLGGEATADMEDYAKAGKVETATAAEVDVSTAVEGQAAKAGN